jgi:hypothetical protein
VQKSAEQSLSEPRSHDGASAEIATRPMTAEIVVANKVAVALAADSTVTIRGGGADKTYNTANKLFTISKLYPVGALIYGSTNINRIPLEVIIKEFRLTLPDQEKPTLKEYADEFLEFLRNSVPISTQDHADNFAAVVREYCRQLGTNIRNAVLDRQVNPADINTVRAITREFVSDFRNRVSAAGQSASMQNVDRATLSQMYPRVVDDAVNTFFRLFSPTPAICRSIIELVYSANPYPAEAGCPTVAGRRRTRAAPAGTTPAVRWS